MTNDAMVLFLLVVCEFRGQREGRVAGSAVLRLRMFTKCCSKECTIELETTGQKPDVVEVLHPAVCLPEVNHGVELLGKNSFAWVTRARRRHLNKRGVVGLGG